MARKTFVPNPNPITYATDFDMYYFAALADGLNLFDAEDTANSYCSYDLAYYLGIERYVGEFKYAY